MFSKFTRMHISFAGLVYYLLKICTLRSHLSYPSNHTLTTILFCFYEFAFLVSHMVILCKTGLCPVYLTYQNVLKVHPCCCKWQDVFFLITEIHNHTHNHTHMCVCVYIYIYTHTHISVQFSPVTQSCLTLCDPMNHSTPGLPVHHQLLEFTQTHVHWVGDDFYCPLLLPSIIPSIRVFSNESALSIRWPKYWSFSFNISPSNENPELISFRMDWLELLAVQGTLKSLLQHHSSKASILRHSALHTYISPHHRSNF